MWSFELAVMAAMIAVNAVFAGYEIALASIGLARLERLAASRRRGANAAVHMKRNIEASLTVVQLGITLVGAIAAAVGGAGAEESFAPLLESRLGLTERASEVMAIAFVVLPLTFVTILVGELFPKIFALRNAERVCLALSPLMRGISIAVRPIVWVFETFVSRVLTWAERTLGTTRDPSANTELQEIAAAVATARASRLIGEREAAIIIGATEMRSRPIRDVMVPSVHMVTLEADASMADNFEASQLHMHTRFPVVARRGDIQSVCGYINFKDLVASLHQAGPAVRTATIVRHIPSVPDTQEVASCFERLMRDHSHIALVRDHDGDVVGMVTLEDILEEIVGEIEDEYDSLPDHLVEAGAGWVVGGGVTLGRIGAETGLHLQAPEHEGESCAFDQWIATALERDVQRGDVVEHDGVRVTVRKVRRRRVLEAALQRVGTVPISATRATQ